MALQWTAGWASVGPLRLAYETTGPDRGEPLLLVMGLGGQLIHWPEALCTRLVAAGFRLIRYDHRDAGLSDAADAGVPVQLPRAWLKARRGKPVASNYTLFDLAADAVGLLDALGVRRAHWAGVSMGGMVAQIAAARYPGRVASLTSIMSSTNDPRLPAARFDVLLAMAGLGPKPRSREAYARRTVALLERVGSPGFPTPRSYRRTLAEAAWDRGFRPEGTARQAQAVLATGSFEALLPEIRVPAQVLHGLADPLLRPACGMRSAALIREARLQLVPGMGHDFALPLMPLWAETIRTTAGRA